MANDVDDRAGNVTGGASGVDEPPTASEAPTASRTETAAPPERGQPPRKHGRETAADMLRTLAVVMALVVPMWFLAQPPDGDEQVLRVVDPAGELSAFQDAVPQAPAPVGLPEGWRPTSSTLQQDPDGLRVGYVTPAGDYAELAASTAPPQEYLPEITGIGARQLEDVQVDGQQWQQYVDEDGSLSLVRAYDPALVVVGSLRSSADLAELRALAGSLEQR